MNALTNVQTIHNHQGLPAFVVIPYEQYQEFIQSKEQPQEQAINMDTAVPSVVVDNVFDNGISALKAWREYLELTQAEVAERAGMTQSAYSQHEKAEKLRKPTREKLAKALGINAEQLNF